MVFIILLIVIFVFLYCKIRHDIKNVWSSLFGNSSIKQVINQQNFDSSETPKSLFGMENSYLPLIKKDFPDLNINELKSMAENYIIEYLNSLESKKFECKYVSDKMNSFVTSAINDLENDTVSYNSIKVHNTVLSRYEKKDGIATIKFQTSIEYLYKKNNDEYKKIQDRFSTEFIYIIDSEQVIDEANALGLNCPNCGAPVKSLGDKHCSYCGSGIKDIVKKTWILNNISQF